MTDFDQRPGEIALPFDPAASASDARLAFIGRIRSPWTDRSDCPRNLRIARERRAPARVEVDLPYRPGLAGLGEHKHIILLYWMDRARRDLIVQMPRHAEQALGTFALRSPVRPNPVAIGIVTLLGLDAATGLIEIDAIDCLDCTPLIDIKPYFPSTDAFGD